jgi:hypothetical protein
MREFELDDEEERLRSCLFNPLTEDELITLLQKTGAEFHALPREDHESRRLAALEQLLGVLKYLSTFRAARNCCAPLYELMGALLDACKGLENSLTRPAKYQGGSKIPFRKTINMVRAAVAVTIWKDDAGWKLNDAAKAAAKALNVDAKEILYFRNNLLKGRIADVEDEYYSLLRMARAVRTTKTQGPQSKG